MNKVVDGAKIELGFKFERRTPIIKTEPAFLTQAKLESKDGYALRYIALRIIDQLNQNIDPDAFAYCWEPNDNDNFICENILNLNNGYGIRCMNDDIIYALYIASTGNVMAMMSVDDEDESEYRVLIC